MFDAGVYPYPPSPGSTVDGQAQEPVQERRPCDSTGSLTGKITALGAGALGLLVILALTATLGVLPTYIAVEMSIAVEIVRGIFLRSPGAPS